MKSEINSKFLHFTSATLSEAFLTSTKLSIHKGGFQRALTYKTIHHMYKTRLVVGTTRRPLFEDFYISNIIHFNIHISKPLYLKIPIVKKLHTLEIRIRGLAVACKLFVFFVYLSLKSK